MNLILASIGVFLCGYSVACCNLVGCQEFPRCFHRGDVKLTINGEKELKWLPGSTLMNTLSVNGIFLSSACGGKGLADRYKCQGVTKEGGEILPSEVPSLQS